MLLCFQEGCWFAACFFFFNQFMGISETQVNHGLFCTILSLDGFTLAIVIMNNNMQQYILSVSHPLKLRSVFQSVIFFPVLLS